jgi:signal transduction histidine kinase
VNVASRVAGLELAEEAALRRVATLVARGVPPEEAFGAVATEVGRLFLVDVANIIRYEPDGTLTMVASAEDRFPVGRQWPLGGRNVGTLVFETGRPARIDSYADSTGPLADDVRERGVRSAVGTPIIVEGRLWGAIGVASTQEEPLPADTEARLASFTELAATAISNAEARTEVAASRARIAAAADEERRRVVRDLHDGAQQRLVALRVQLELVEELLKADHVAGVAKLHSLGPEVDEALDEIRHLARGVYPPLLSESGLMEALTSAVRKLPIAGLIEPDGAVGRYPSEIESAVYFCCLEAMQNASKHAEGAHQVVVSLQVGVDLRFEVRDDGAGFPDDGRADGRGLTNMRDRVAAVGGEVSVTSELGEGTLVAGSVPL